MENKEKFSIMVVDGEIVDLNNISYEELDKLQQKLEIQESDIRNKIDAILDKNYD